jgi:hypothetical protein
MSNTSELIARQQKPLSTRPDVPAHAVKEIAGGSNALLADVFTLYLGLRDYASEFSKAI